MVRRLIGALMLTLGLAACNPVTPGSERAAGWSGSWTGEARTDTEHTALVLDITKTGDDYSATMTLPDIGVTGWPAIAVEPGEAGLELTFPSDSGPQQMTLQASGGRVTGRWVEPRFAEAAILSLEADPQPRARGGEAAGIAGPAGLLGVELLLPEGDGPFVGVVYVHGSGPQPRDSSRFDASVMAAAGIAAVIYDKRGVGQSEGDYASASFEDLAADAAAVAAWLAARPEISAVGFSGHSQGGWIGPLAAVNWGDAAFVISSAGPAVSPRREAQWDYVRALRRNGGDTASEAAVRAYIDLWHDGIRSGDWSAFEAARVAAAGEAWYTASGLDAFEAAGPGFADFYRRFMDYEPMPTLQALDAPLLAILTPDDESIDSVETIALLEDLIARGRNITLTVYPGFDHTMRRLGPEGSPLRFPAHPTDYFSNQIDFIQSATEQGPVREQRSGHLR